jgi:hypothetical protein
MDNGIDNSRRKSFFGLVFLPLSEDDVFVNEWRSSGARSVLFYTSFSVLQWRCEFFKVDGEKFCSFQPKLSFFPLLL